MPSFYNSGSLAVLLGKVEIRFHVKLFGNMKRTECLTLKQPVFSNVGFITEVPCISKIIFYENHLIKKDGNNCLIMTRGKKR
jgi:hypothetical protein